MPKPIPATDHSSGVQLAATKLAEKLRELPKILSAGSEDTKMYWLNFLTAGSLEIATRAWCGVPKNEREEEEWELDWVAKLLTQFFDCAELPISTISWLRYGKPPELLFVQREKDPKAARQFHQLVKLYPDVLGRDLTLSDYRPKHNSVHLALMGAGIVGGFCTLSEAQLAEWFDQNCSCRDPHSADCLAELRGKVVNTFDEYKSLVGPHLAHRNTAPEQMGAMRFIT